MRRKFNMSYVDEIYAKVVEQNPGEAEFHQAVILLDWLLMQMRRNTEVFLY